MADFNSLTGGSIDILSFVFGGGGLLMPRGFWLPGSLSSHIGHFGTGASAGYGQGSLVSGQGPYPYSHLSLGNDMGLGIKTQVGSHNILGFSFISGTTHLCKTASTKLFSASTIINGAKVNVTGAKLTLTGIDVTLAAPNVLITGTNVKIFGAPGSVMTGVNIAACPGKKNFDIKHPTKEGHRLRHVCLEGPSADVFLRGKLQDECTIKLPEYWKNLVDLDTISVILTPIGSYQELFVEKIESNTNITIKNNVEGSINCHYVIYGERIDVEKNIPEYPGLTPYDYPGDNNQCNINGL